MRDQVTWCALSTVRPQVQVAASVLAERFVGTEKAGGYFFLPDGSEDPFWKALRERCGECVVSGAPCPHPQRGQECSLHPCGHDIRRMPAGGLIPMRLMGRAVAAGAYMRERGLDRTMSWPLFLFGYVLLALQVGATTKGVMVGA
jgi:hypothetical protein